MILDLIRVDLKFVLHACKRKIAFLFSIIENNGEVDFLPKI